MFLLVNLHFNVWQAHGSFEIILIVDHAFQILWNRLVVLFLNPGKTFVALLMRITYQMALTDNLSLLHVFLYFLCFVDLA